MIDWVSVEEPDWSAESISHFRHFQNCCNRDTIFKYNLKSEKVGTVWKTQIKKESSDF